MLGLPNLKIKGKTKRIKKELKWCHPANGLLQNKEFLGFSQNVYVGCTEFHEFGALVLSALFFLPHYNLEVWLLTHTIFSSVFSKINLGFCDFLTLLYTLFKKNPTEFEKYHITVMLLVIYCQDIFNHRVHCILGSKSIYCVLHRLTKAALVWCLLHSILH